MAYAPTLSAFLDANPAPRVEVLFDSLHPDATTLSVYRTADRRTYTLRGGVRVATAGAFTRIDSEIPFNIPVTYYAEMFDVAGLPLGVTDSTTVTVYNDDTWLHNPLDPAGAVRVTVMDSTARSISRPTSGEVLYPRGRRVGVIVAQPRRGIAGLTFDVFTDALEDADKVSAMLGSYESDTTPVLCIRLGIESRMRIPKPFYMGVIDIAEEDFDLRNGGEVVIHRMSGDEVAPPAPGIFVPLLTNADLNAFYASNADLNNDSVSNLEVNRKYELAGTV